MSNSPKFLLDENIPKSVRKLLESNGFSAEYDRKGVNNSRLISSAKSKMCVLISRDSDFAKTFMYPPEEYFGIIVFQIHPPKAEKLVKALSSLLAEVKEFRGKLFVVEEAGFEVKEGVLEKL